MPVCNDAEDFAHTRVVVNFSYQRPRATDFRHGTETQSRGSVEPIC